MRTSRQPTKPPCVSNEFATEGCGCAEACIGDAGRQAAAAAQAKRDEKVADGDGDLSLSRSGHSSQGVRRRQKHGLFTYREAYAIIRGAASEFNGTRGYLSEDDTRGTRSSVSGSLRQAQSAVPTSMPEGTLGYFLPSDCVVDTSAEAGAGDKWLVDRPAGDCHSQSGAVHSNVRKGTAAKCQVWVVLKL